MDEQRRLDDMVDGNGEPMSDAHKALMRKVEACKNELIADHAAKLEQHVEERHHPALAEIAQQLNKTPAELVQDFITSLETSNRVVDALDGPLIVGLDGTGRRREEDGIIFQMRDMQLQLRNGVRHKATLTAPQWVFAGTALTTLATIAVALITGGATP